MPSRYALPRRGAHGPDHAAITQISICLAVRRVLRAARGPGDHEALARRIAEGVVADFDRAGWTVQAPERTAHSTPLSGPERGE